MKKSILRSPRGVLYTKLVFAMGILVAPFFGAPAVMAVDCNGAASATDCAVTDTTSYSGRYRTVMVGDGIFEDNSSGSVTVNVPACSAGPATIVNSTLSWAIRDTDGAFWDDSVNLSVDGGAATAMTQNRRYKAQAPAGAPTQPFYSWYSADMTAQAQAGSHTYAVTGIDTSGTADVDTTQWGFAVHVIYECPEFAPVDIYRKDGLDLHWYNWGSYAQNRSELICQEFTADTVARTINVDMILPGSAGPTRQADIWYKTGTGSAPAATAYDLLTDVNTPANGGQVLQRLALAANDPEWDQYSGTITIPANHTYACVQTDSSFNTGEHPDSATARGASMFVGGSWFAVQQSSATMSLGNLVWNDANNNGVVDGSEAGLPGVQVQLRSSTGALLGTTTTDANGNYLFTSLSPGDYQVTIPALQTALESNGVRYVTSTGTNGSTTGPYEPSASASSDINNDDNGTYQTSAIEPLVVSDVTLTANGEPTNDGDTDNNTNLTIDFGFFLPASLGDYVWYDANNDGVQDTSETMCAEGMEGMTATLHNSSDDSVVATMTLDGSCKYLFENLVPGDYYVTFANKPSDMVWTTANSGDDATDSDVDTNGRTGVYTLAAGDRNLTVDAGLWREVEELAQTGNSLTTILSVAGGVMALAATAGVVLRRYL